jgi:ABC-type transport system involved in multi-copper enzyme maturation permease subunit
MLQLAAISDYVPTQALIAGIIIVVGTLVYGLADVLRFSWKRVWAIGSVCFDESIRRRVLWIIPIAIFGVIVVSQLQKPLDEQDAIRQTTKFCLFATGMLVVMSVMILACTNLPREIENRVIYTIVTKPTTRLEIVLGKIVGFARVSGAILLIMGLFSYGYLSLRAWSLRRDISERLEIGRVDPLSRPALEHYREFGLLTSKRMEMPAMYQIYSRVPVETDTKRYIFGGSDEDIIAPFTIDPATLTVAAGGESQFLPYGVLIHGKISVIHNPNAKPPEAPKPAASQPFISPLLVQPVAGAPKQETLGVSFNILDQYQNLLLGPDKINGGKSVILEDKPGDQDVYAIISPEHAAQLQGKPKIYVQMLASTEQMEFGVDENKGFELLIPQTTPPQPKMLPVQQTGPTIFRGRQGTSGQQLRGSEHDAPVAIFPFRNAVTDAVNGMVPMELHVSIERTGAEDSTEDASTKLEIRIANRQTGKTTEPIYLYPENGRSSFFNVPAETLSGGNFDVLMRCLTESQWVGLQVTSLGVVGAEQPFVWNLFLSLLVVWLMVLLVVVIAIFCSTFLSWPIAIVLTAVILLGHWGVSQLGDATAPGIGNMIATDMKLTDPRKAKVVSSGVEALSTFLKTVSSVLPDISQYSPSEDIEKGLVVPMARLTDAAAVTLGFGIPLTALAYICLKNKEVAP